MKKDQFIRGMLFRVPIDIIFYEIDIAFIDKLANKFNVASFAIMRDIVISLGGRL